MACCNKFLTRTAIVALLAGLLAGCGGGGGGSAATPAPPPVPPAASNVMVASVDGGPANSGYNVNRLFVDVKICQPGSSQCLTIDHVLLDTGSTGLRLLSSLVKPALSLDKLTGATGFPLFNCAQFVDSTFAWGTVVAADIVLGGKTASAVPIQLIADPAAGRAPSACSVGGTEMTSAADLGANGILGMGLFRDDCGSGCQYTFHNGFYYTCSSASCSSTTGVKVGVAQQLKNPVPLFATDNNGMLLDLPEAGAGTVTGLKGSLIFGIGTQSNNQPTGTRVLSTNASGYLTTLLGGQSMSGSFLDTGSNGLFFDSSSIPVCPDSTGFYCPAALTSLSATLVGANQARAAITFTIDNASAMFGNASRVVLPNLSGPFGDPTSFDWGLPFFYGRRVFIGIEGQPSSLGSGPYYAF